jgi:hypothetical protein
MPINLKPTCACWSELGPTAAFQANLNIKRVWAQNGKNKLVRNLNVKGN